MSGYNVILLDRLGRGVGHARVVLTSIEQPDFSNLRLGPSLTSAEDKLKRWEENPFFSQQEFDISLENKDILSEIKQEVNASLLPEDNPMLQERRLQLDVKQEADSSLNDTEASSSAVTEASSSAVTEASSSAVTETSPRVMTNNTSIFNLGLTEAMPRSFSSTGERKTLITSSSQSSEDANRNKNRVMSENTRRMLSKPQNYGFQRVCQVRTDGSVVNVLYRGPRDKGSSGVKSFVNRAVLEKIISNYEQLQQENFCFKKVKYNLSPDYEVEEEIYTKSPRKQPQGSIHSIYNEFMTMNKVGAEAVGSEEIDDLSLVLDSNSDDSSDDSITIVTDSEGEGEEGSAVLTSLDLENNKPGSEEAGYQKAIGSGVSKLDDAQQNPNLSLDDVMINRLAQKIVERNEKAIAASLEQKKETELLNSDRGRSNLVNSYLSDSSGDDMLLMEEDDPHDVNFKGYQQVNSSCKNKTSAIKRKKQEPGVFKSTVNYSKNKMNKYVADKSGIVPKDERKFSRLEVKNEISKTPKNTKTQGKYSKKFKEDYNNNSKPKPPSPPKPLSFKIPKRKSSDPSSSQMSVSNQVVRLDGRIMLLRNFLAEEQILPGVDIDSFINGDNEFNHLFNKVDAIKTKHTKKTNKTDDKSEVNDLTDKGWDVLKKVSTDEERIKLAQDQFENAVRSDPGRNLTVHCFRKLKSSTVLPEVLDSGSIMIDSGRLVSFPGFRLENGEVSDPTHSPSKKIKYVDFVTGMKAVFYNNYVEKVKNKAGSADAFDQFKTYLGHYKAGQEETANFLSFYCKDKDLDERHMREVMDLERQFSMFCSNYGEADVRHCPSCDRKHKFCQ